MPYLPADAPLTLRDLSGITGPLGGRTAIEGWLPERTIFFASGRAALFGALHALGVGRDAEVLLPSYVCESVVTPVLASGARPTFYPIGRTLRPDLAALESAIGPKSRAVVLIHYLGFPAPVEEVRATCDRRHVALIEDCAHALFSRVGERLLGTFGSAAFWSPWKSLPSPDGGLLALNDLSLSYRGPLSPPWRLRALPRLVYRALGTLETRIGWSPRLSLLRRAALRRTLHQRTSGAAVNVREGAPISRRLLRAAQPAAIVHKRRDHYLRLLDVVGRLDWAAPIFESLPPGVCPLGLPIVAEERDRWRDTLLSQGINVRTYWEQLPAEVDTARFPDAAWLRDRILILPVHQGLEPAHVEWLERLLPTLSLRGADGSLAHR